MSPKKSTSNPINEFVEGLPKKSPIDAVATADAEAMVNAAAAEAEYDDAKLVIEERDPERVPKVAVKSRGKTKDKLIEADKKLHKKVCALFKKSKAGSFKERLDYNRYYLYNIKDLTIGTYKRVVEQGNLSFSSEAEALSFYDKNKSVLVDFVIKSGLDISQFHQMDWVRLSHDEEKRDRELRVKKQS